jgi:hypothetical protein
MKKHNWEDGICINCGIKRKKITEKVLMAKINQPPYKIYRFDIYFEYFSGSDKLEKRPDCK